MTEPANATASYNRPHYSREEYNHIQDMANLDFQPGLHVGDMAPDVVVSDLEGRPVRLSDFRGKKNVVFEFGSITAPIFINDIVDLNRLHGKFRDNDIQFLIIYVREGHPAENYPAHRSLEQKLSHARDLQRLENVAFPVLVDSLEGTAHHLYGLRPSPVWVINKEGLVVHKSSWLVADELEMVLDHLLRAEKWLAEGLRTRRVYAETWRELWINRSVHQRVLERAGPSARGEVVQAFGLDPVTQGQK
ncbi:peroxiredoxin family protein [Pseudorhodoplanes sp.]|jgi:peroxiredoxin|uniref:peroxiredoxin family protein n=1 Tax=Pseudorhodoplanes sp. TaxID=1934341 RepID=UPI002B567311|nr:deiodinase-like protein [Pseudorhodoplanes sp.]HWV40259.1 deiodinase-like protein [Pseudorhodoplanes sp.]